MKKSDKMLWEGVDENNLRKVALALNLGANVNAKGYLDSTPLHGAVLRDNIAIAKLLIDSGADVNIKRWDGKTPLHWAVLVDNIKIAKLLIDSGAKVNIKDKYGNTHLDDAKSEEMEALLIEHGAK